VLTSPLVGLICCSALVPQSQAADNVVLQWNRVLLAAIAETNTSPPIASRAIAITHTAMFDAWAAYDAVAVSTRLGGTLRRPDSERTLENKQQAISFAAYRSLLDLFPSQRAGFDALISSFGYDTSDMSADPASPSGIGNICAQARLEYRHQDGSNQLGDLYPGLYSDYTRYSPVNTMDML
jgi:hypothetical protein